MAFIILVSTAHSFAVEVKSAKLDASKKNLLVDVVYSGGCGTNNFTMAFIGCFEPYPVTCEAEILHISNDYCEKKMRQTLVISLANYGLGMSTYKGAILTINGSPAYAGGKTTSTKVTLP